jgi:beta-lactamase class A
MIEYIGSRKKRRGIPVWLTIISLIICVVVVGQIVHKMTTKTTVSPLPDTPQETSNVITRLFTKKKNPEDLRQKIKETIGTSWKNYSVLVRDLNSDFSMGLGEHVIFTGASINKIPILAVLYYKHQQGAVDMEKVVTLQQDDIQDYGTGSIRYDPVGSTYTVKTLARLMIEQSDNTAAFLLGNYVLGMDTIQQYMNNWGMEQTDMGNNKTSNSDMGILFEKIYHEKIANHAYTMDMLSYMINTEFEDRIPILLPKTAKVYHKTGNGAGVVNDVGIVKTDKNAYYIGLLTSDVTDEKATTELMGKVSKTVYDFMEN